MAYARLKKDLALPQAPGQTASFKSKEIKQNLRRNMKNPQVGLLII